MYNWWSLVIKKNKRSHYDVTMHSCWVPFRLIQLSKYLGRIDGIVFLMSIWLDEKTAGRFSFTVYIYSVSWKYGVGLKDWKEVESFIIFLNKTTCLGDRKKKEMGSIMGWQTVLPALLWRQPWSVRWHCTHMLPLYTTAGCRNRAPDHWPELGEVD